jgi:hypothetical protein
VCADSRFRLRESAVWASRVRDCPMARSRVAISLCAIGDEWGVSSRGVLRWRLVTRGDGCIGAVGAF